VPQARGEPCSSCGSPANSMQGSKQFGLPPNTPLQSHAAAAAASAPLCAMAAAAGGALLSGPLGARVAPHPCKVAGAPPPWGSWSTAPAPAACGTCQCVGGACSGQLLWGGARGKQIAVLLRHRPQTYCAGSCLPGRRVITGSSSGVCTVRSAPCGLRRRMGGVQK